MLLFMGLYYNALQKVSKDRLSNISKYVKHWRREGGGAGQWGIAQF